MLQDLPFIADVRWCTERWCTASAPKGAAFLQKAARKNATIPPVKCELPGNVGTETFDVAPIAADEPEPDRGKDEEEEEGAVCVGCRGRKRKSQTGGVTLNAIPRCTPCPLKVRTSPGQPKMPGWVGGKSLTGWGPNLSDS